MGIKVMSAALVIVMSLFYTDISQAADLSDTIATTPTLTTLSAAIKAAGVTETLKGKGPFTVFAPTDEAFKASSGEHDDESHEA